MRNKIIAVNAVIILVMGLLSFVVVRQSLLAAAQDETQLTDRAKHSVQGAAARLQLDGLRNERWLATKAAEAPAKEVISRATASARGDAATSLCDSILSASKGNASFAGTPSLVLVVDANSKILGRNGSSLSRGDDLGAAYPALKDAIANTRSGSEVWANKARNDQYLVSYAPIRDEKGTAAGMLVVGLTLADELARVNESVSGAGLLLFAGAGEDLQLVAVAAGTPDSVRDAVEKSGRVDVKAAVSSGHTTAGNVGGSIIVASIPLEAFGDGKKAAVAVPAPATLLEGAAAIPLSILGIALLGLVMVAGAGWLLGSYISRPVAQLEEGLLAILNGQTDKRFQLEHAELGGLAFRIDQLLNQLMGIEEDNTDDEGRVSSAPTAARFNDAMSVDDKKAEGGGAQALAAEPAQAYYARLYREYIGAKKGLGEATDHITEDAFATRIQGMEQEATQKHGRPVRYQVQANDKEVTLLAVPL